MVEQPATQSLGGCGEPPGRAKIGVARPWIAARVIMREDDRSAAMIGCINDDLPKGQIDEGGAAAVMGKVKATALAIEMRHPQAFLIRVLLVETARKEVAGGGDSGDGQRGF